MRYAQHVTLRPCKRPFYEPFLALEKRFPRPGRTLRPPRRGNFRLRPIGRKKILHFGQDDKRGTKDEKETTKNRPGTKSRPAKNTKKKTLIPPHLACGLKHNRLLQKGNRLRQPFVNGHQPILMLNANRTVIADHAQSAENFVPFL